MRKRVQRVLCPVLFVVVSVIVLATHTVSANDPLFELVWRWGDIYQLPGSMGVQVTDWDGDGENESFMADSRFVFTIDHTEEYQFIQTWSAPSGKGWGIIDLHGDANKELWIIDKDGHISTYQPYEFTPHDFGVLGDDWNGTIGDAVISDVAGDGTQQLIVSVYTTGIWHLEAYDLPQLNRLWQYEVNPNATIFDTFTFKVGQMDNDTPQEIAFNNGIVIDGGTQEVEWTYNDQFTNHFVVGDIDNDGLDEIVDGRIVAYDVDTRTPKWQIDDASASRLLLADLFGDETPELVVGDRYRNINVYDMVSRDIVQSFDNPNGGVSGLGVGDADNDGELDLLWGSGSSSSAPDKVHLAPIESSQARFTFAEQNGPFAVIPLQMNEDDRLELLVFYGSSYPYGYFVIDSETHLPETEIMQNINLPIRPINSQFEFLYVNADDDLFDEIVLGLGNDMVLLDNDGTILVQNDLRAAHTPEWLGDVDGDGALEVVTRSSSRVYILAFDTLEVEWESVSIDGVVDDIAVGDVDEDGRFEIVFHASGSYLHAYDGETKLLDWQMSSGQNAQAVAIGNVDNEGGLEIVIHDTYALHFYDAKTQQLITSTRLFSSGATYVQDLTLTQLYETEHPQLMVSNSSNLHNSGLMIFDHPYDPEPRETLSPGIGILTLSDVDNDQQLDLFRSQNGFVHYEMQDKFPDGTPPRARSLTPPPASDFISRNAFIEAQFTELLDTAAITNETIQLRIGETPIATTFSYDSVTHVMRLTPDEALPPNTEITVWLSSMLIDAAGLPLDSNLNGVGGESNDAYTWQFTTGSGVDNVAPAIENVVVAPNPVWSGRVVSLSVQIDDSDQIATSTVRRVEYFLDAVGTAGEGKLLEPVDGSFDERTELATAEIDTAGWDGEHTIFIFAEDNVGNWSEPTAYTISITPEDEGNWSMFGFDAAHTGYNPHQAMIADFTFAWERQLSESFEFTSPWSTGQVAVANDIIVTNISQRHDGGGITAFDATSGTELWRYTLENKHSINPPSIGYGLVYFQQGNSSNDTVLHALNLLTGESVWEAPFRAQWQRYYAPTIADGDVYISGGEHNGVYSFDANTGDEQWFADMPQQDPWTPTYYDNMIYSVLEGTLFTTDLRFGRLDWSLQLEDNYEADVVSLSDGVAYVALDSRVVAVDIETQTELWNITGEFYSGTPAIAGDELYVQDQGSLRGLNKDTGELLWEFTQDETLVGSPIVAGNSVFVASADRTWAIDLTTRLPYWTVSRGGWLTVANDQLFIVQDDSLLTVYNAELGVPTPLPPVDPDVFVSVESVNVAVEDGNRLVATIEPYNVTKPITYHWAVSPNTGVLYDSSQDETQTINFESSEDGSELLISGIEMGAYTVRLSATNALGDESETILSEVTVTVDEAGQIVLDNVRQNALYLPFLRAR